ncbi:MAG: DeoR/GlpR transcriptional regulator [Erysipelotrichaceae bacterium]|nr:DeoR/GlpR transcriptional regulator [Erysipelotrichaceae bacterium]
MNTERTTGIITLLEKYGYVSVRDLANLLHVSAPTVRRSLSELEREGIVVRNHGGVTLAGNGLPKPFSYRFSDMKEEKRRIAQAACSLLTDNSIIYLDTSTTVMCMIDYLKSRRNITVVTNSVPAIQLLHGYGIPVKCTGGDLNDESMGFVGYAAESYLASIRTDFAFISTPAIGLDGRISDYSEQETHLRKVAMANSARCVYLFEKQKLNQSAIFTLCNSSDVDYLISNADLGSVFPDMEISRYRSDPDVFIARVR